jgi:four helix bundle protein
MATIKSFEEIEAWRKARLFSKEIFELTQGGSFSRDFALRDQINRSSGSIMDNIAEGFERGGTKEFIQFLSIAKGSAGEVRSQLYRAHDRNHIDNNKCAMLMEQIKEVSMTIAGFIVYLRATDIKE